MNVFMMSTPLVDGIDAAGKERGRKRPSYKIPMRAQFIGRCADKRKPADRVEWRVLWGEPEGARFSYEIPHLK
jgi:hypothetical protein